MLPMISYHDEHFILLETTTSLSSRETCSLKIRENLKKVTKCSHFQKTQPLLCYMVSNS